MSTFVDFKRELIVECPQKDNVIAKKIGFRDRRPNKCSKSQMKHVLKLLENHSYKQVVEMTRIRKSTFIKHKRNASLKNQ